MLQVGALWSSLAQSAAVNFDAYRVTCDRRVGKRFVVFFALTKYAGCQGLTDMRISRQQGGAAENDSRVRMTASHSDLWRERLTAPAYQVAEAARYARTTSRTIGNWQRLRGERHGAIAPRGTRMAISYLQLIEIGVVAAMRKSGVTLRKIRQAREYLRAEFSSEFPFAHYRFKTDGKILFMDYDQIIESDKDKLLSLNEHGQLAWNEILSALLQEFEYDPGIGMVLRWKVDGIDSPVRLDPRIAFGAPQVNGIATWVLSSRWESGESLSDIASDYELSPQLVSAALRFEGVQIDPDRANQWTH